MGRGDEDQADQSPGHRMEWPPCSVRAWRTRGGQSMSLARGLPEGEQFPRPRCVLEWLLEVRQRLGQGGCRQSISLDVGVGRAVHRRSSGAGQEPLEENQVGPKVLGVSEEEPRMWKGEREVVSFGDGQESTCGVRRPRQEGNLSSSLTAALWKDVPSQAAVRNQKLREVGIGDFSLPGSPRVLQESPQVSSAVKQVRGGCPLRWWQLLKGASCPVTVLRPPPSRGCCPQPRDPSGWSGGLSLLYMLRARGWGWRE